MLRLQDESRKNSLFFPQLVMDVYVAPGSAGG